MQEFEAIFYDLPDGREPAKEFIDSLDKRCAPKWYEPLRSCSRTAHSSEPYSKALEDGIFEVRAKGWDRHIAGPLFLLRGA